jgi:hypothetical protein
MVISMAWLIETNKLERMILLDTSKELKNKFENHKYIFMSFNEKNTFFGVF